MTLVSLRKDALHAQTDVTVIAESLKLTVRMVCAVEPRVFAFRSVLGLLLYAVKMRESFRPTQCVGALVVGLKCAFVRLDIAMNGVEYALIPIEKMHIQGVEFFH